MYVSNLTVLLLLANANIDQKRDTLIRYLLDELYMYEESHADALSPYPSDALNGVAFTTLSAQWEQCFRESLCSIEQKLTHLTTSSANGLSIYQPQLRE